MDISGLSFISSSVLIFNCWFFSSWILFVTCSASLPTPAIPLSTLASLLLPADGSRPWREPLRCLELEEKLCRSDDSRAGIALPLPTPPGVLGALSHRLWNEERSLLGELGGGCLDGSVE